MGMLVEGRWHDVWYDTKASKGRFVRSESQFRNWVTADGSAGPTGKAGFRAEPNRYHLYVSFACPWAHRTLIFRKLKGLEPLIAISAVNTYMGKEGWTFDPGPGVIPDTVNDTRCLYELYTLADPKYSGRATIPVLWDKKQRTIVSNESADIIRMFNSAFDEVGANSNDFYPAPLRAEIDELNTFIYPNVNNGVYRTGFATTQEAYEESFTTLFEALDSLDATRDAPLPHGRADNGSGLEVVHDAGEIRSGVFWALQMQPAAHRRLPESMGLRVRSVSNARSRRNRPCRLHQDALLRQSREHQSDGDHSARAGDRFLGAA